MDKFSLGAVSNKGSTTRGPCQQGQRCILMLLVHVAKGEMGTPHLATHAVALGQASTAYDMFEHRADGCVRAVIRPDGPSAEEPRT
ncbi:hypothetical protein [Streptomyces sp. NRRL S-1521]|uniref:hypothetical protein n=1 Tax=Streptomyces sp. NRRL S-1521 TaxID=1609100 RepID=UPI000746961F|nr:hypothetical protein [Streptomyces sp. NRRL S-1521]KUL53408.1 hypothetical protein ADL30_20135 [Streptomyces sp. NRRL S-1521]